jgi:hypothetical protein
MWNFLLGRTEMSKTITRQMIADNPDIVLTELLANIDALNAKLKTGKEHGWIPKKIKEVREEGKKLVQKCYLSQCEAMLKAADEKQTEFKEAWEKQLKVDSIANLSKQNYEKAEIEGMTKKQLDALVVDVTGNKRKLTPYQLNILRAQLPEEPGAGNENLRDQLEIWIQHEKALQPWFDKKLDADVRHYRMATSDVAMGQVRGNTVGYDIDELINKEGAE